MPKHSYKAKENLRNVTKAGSFTKEESKKINKKARQMGYTTSSWIRAVVLDALEDGGF